MRIAILSATALLAVGTLAACSSSSDSTEAVGGMTECTMDALAQPAQDAATALGATNVYTLDSVDCSDGWAVTGGTLGEEGSEMGAPTSFIFQAEGQFWIPKTQGQVCGTMNADDPTAVPDDAEIPSDLYEAGCLT